MLPVAPVTRPADLAGQSNGLLDVRLLTVIPGGRLHWRAARAWYVLADAAAADGLVLRPTSSADSYRSLEQQAALFRARYSETPISGRPTKVWRGHTYWLRPGMATAAVPGTSNHGWGLAVDVNLAAEPRALGWLLAHAPAVGWSWELQAEPWHIRWVLGDREPGAPAPAPPPVPHVPLPYDAVEDPDVILIPKTATPGADGSIPHYKLDRAAKTVEAWHGARLGLTPGLPAVHSSLDGSVQIQDVPTVDPIAGADFWADRLVVVDEGGRTYALQLA